MKIAMCFSGQPRTWEKCYPTWIRLIEELKIKFGAEVDVFCHAWEFNTAPHRVFIETKTPSSYITEDEKNRLISVLNPISYLFENEEVSIQSALDTSLRGEKQRDDHGGSPIVWAASQFYSVMRAGHLKKKYETLHNFKYDACIRMKYDIFFDETQIGCFINTDFIKPKFNTIYSVHTGAEWKGFPNYVLGDIFWFADSVSYDRVCDFYRWLPTIGTRPFCFSLAENILKPEHVIFYYVKMIRMDIVALVSDPKMCRFKDYLQQQLNCNLSGELGGHELI